MIEFIKNNKKLSLSLFVIFVVYTVSSFYQYNTINALQEDVFLASQPSEVEITKHTIETLYSERLEVISNTDRMLEAIKGNDELKFKIESMIRCEKENLLGTGGINCSVDFVNYPGKK